ncbi:putative ribonuclease H-like superfamily [Helianthus annuus]|nr:putative ribonuclease H-like superfamily [Helianthus annuus]
MVNSPKGSVFLRSLDVSAVSKDAALLCRVLDAIVEEVGEKNVIQIVTDNASAYKVSWRNIVYALKLASPLISVLRLVDGERKRAMGYIYAAMASAKTTIEKSFKEKEEFYKETFEIIDQRWECQLHKPLHAASQTIACCWTLLKSVEIFYDNAKEILENEEVMGGLFDCIVKLSHGGVEEQQKVTTELTRYQNAE